MCKGTIESAEKWCDFENLFMREWLAFFFVGVRHSYANQRTAAGKPGQRIEINSQDEQCMGK